MSSILGPVRDLPEELQEPAQRAVQVLDDVMSMEVSLSQKEEDYDFRYIGSKLAVISYYMELLSDKGVMLARDLLTLKQRTVRLRSSLRVRTRELKASPHYVDAPRAEKTDWLEGKLEETTSKLEFYQGIQEVLSEVKQVVADRVQLMRRLDSTLRLQQKLLEARVGLQDPAQFPKDTDGVDID